ncbi:MAG: hypothetical protein KTV45_15900 [Acidimicrobiia bacterium]|nr:hypothetical protein [Acidimicrobiia bacterium]
MTNLNDPKERAFAAAAVLRDANYLHELLAQSAEGVNLAIDEALLVRHPLDDLSEEERLLVADILVVAIKGVLHILLERNPQVSRPELLADTASFLESQAPFRH